MPDAGRSRVVLLLPDISQVGGIESRARWVALELVREGFRVAVVCRELRNDAIRLELEASGVEVMALLSKPGVSISERYATSGILSLPLTIAQKLVEFVAGGLRLRTLLKEIEGGAPLRVVCDDRVMLPFVGFARRSFRHSAIALHRPAGYFLQRGWWARARLSLEMRLVPRTLVLTESDAEQWRNRGFAGVRTIRNASRQLALSGQQVDYESQRIIWFGRMVQVKRVDRLLQAFADVLPRFPAWRLTLIGDGPDRAGLEAQARNLGIDASVDFVGAVDFPERVACEGSVFALTSDVEGWPVSLLEASTLGLCPVVTEFGPSLREIFPDERAALTVSPEVSAVAEGLAKVLSDSAQRMRRGSAAKAAMAALSRDAVVEQWVRVLSEEW